MLDKALRRLPLAERDQVWSVPEHLPGTGVWAGWTPYSDVLDGFNLVACDAWNGLPLIAAWTCSSVVESRRRDARQALAAWGADNLDQMVRLVGHMADVDDPQVVDDLVLASLGAAIGTDVANTNLRDLANLLDHLFFTEGRPTWTTSTAVRRAARGVVERAALIWPGEFGDQLQRARPPFAHSSEWPEVDKRELESNSSTHQVVTRDLGWYVVKHAVEVLFKPRQPSSPQGEEEVDYRLLQAIRGGQLEAPTGLVEMMEAAERDEAGDSLADLTDAELAKLVRRGYAEETSKISDADLSEWALQKYLAEQPPAEFSPPLEELLAKLTGAKREGGCSHEAARNALVANLVRGWGWSHAGFCHFEHEAPPTLVDDAIMRRHGPGASHGERSRVCRFREKYVWAAVDRVAGDLADRLPVWSTEAGEWKLLTALEGIGTPLADPLPTTERSRTGGLPGQTLWKPDGVVAEQFVDTADPGARAELWVTSAEYPDPRTLVRDAVEGWNDAAVLSFQYYQRAHQYCIDELIQVRAIGVRRTDLALIRRDARYTLRGYFRSASWLEGVAYDSPALACWAHWLTWRGEMQGYTSFDANGSPRSVDVLPLVGTVTANYPQDEWPTEAKVWMPAPLIAQDLGVVGMAGDRWSRRYVGRDGGNLAVERDDRATSFGFNHHYLVMEMEALTDLLGDRGYVPAWSIRIQHEATPALWHQEPECVPRPGLEHRYRDAFWLVISDPQDAELEVLQLGSELHRFSDEAE